MVSSNCSSPRHSRRAGAPFFPASPDAPAIVAAMSFRPAFGRFSTAAFSPSKVAPPSASPSTKRA